MLFVIFEQENLNPKSSTQSSKKSTKKFSQKSKCSEYYRILSTLTNIFVKVFV